MRKTLLTLTLGLLSAAQASTITVWYAGNFQGHMDVVNNTILPAFTKANPDIKVNVEFVPWGDLSTKLNAAFAAGTAPDVFMHGAAATAGFVANKRVDPLDTYLAQIDAKDFGSTLNQGQYLGKRYMVPVFGAGRLLVYRKDLFTQAGLDPNKPPTNWSSMLAAAQKLTTRDTSGRIQRAGLLLPSTGIDLQQVFASLLWQAGGSFFDDANKTVKFDGPNGIKALKYLQTLFDTKTGVSPLGEPDSPVSPLVTGRAAMLFAVPDDLADIRQNNPDVYAKLGVAPALKDQRQATLYSFSGFFLSADSKNKADAWKYIRYATSDAALSSFNEAAASIPPLSSLENAGFIRSNPVLTTYVKNMRYAQGNPNVPNWTKMRDLLSQQLEQAIYGRADAAAALRTAAAAVRRELPQ